MEDFARESVALLACAVDFFRSQICHATQRRRRISRLPFTSHANDRRCRSIDFQTAATAASASDTAKRFDTHVANFCGGIIRAAPQFSVENYAAANTGAQRHTYYTALSPCCALPHLADGGGVCVVLYNCRALQCFAKSTR